ncbi:MFS transporter [Rhizobium sp. TRM95796]|uniref:MFS transporter n=1 Tax=Rhizobium sp. TRM95796 TaxID=2979862 RepID=UPI0021E941DE|nr:MFS transporter [Rhizobium sp. TRM95796]MCV3767509.1 MFS transporter [Rhizobium sp. TRM95796]
MTTPVRSAAPPLTGSDPRERIAVSLLFLANGLYIGAWSPKLPVIAETLSLSPQWMGYLLLFFGVGSVTIMPIAGAQIARFGSSKVAMAFSILFLPLMLILTFMPNFASAAVIVFLLGGFAGAMDVAMNANAVEVEKRMRRAIMSSCHAYWSLGGLIGSATGGALIDQFGPAWHAVIITVFNAGVVALALAWLMPDGPHAEEHHDAAPRPSIFSSPLPWLLGFMALFSMLQEGIVIDWSALYLSRELGATLTVASLAAGSFHATMMVVRFAGDAVRDRLGAVKTMRVSGVIAFAGMWIGAFAPHPYVAVFGFALAGLGVANLVPIAFSAAGNLPGMAKGVGLSVVTAMGYSGTLFAPTLFGFVVEHTGYQAIYIGAPLLLAIVLALSGLARHADGVKGGGH